MTTPFTAMFRYFADDEFRGSSPAYFTLADALANDPAPAEPLLAAPPTQRRALLLFAAVQFLLRGAARGHPLAAYYPTLGGRRAPDAGLLAAFRDLTGEFGAELAELCATRRTQTNEVRRAAVLRPAFALAAAGRPVTLVELGTSAGLLLLTDRYGYRYRYGNGREVRAGRSDGLVLDCTVSGDGWSEPAAADLTVADRVGLDLAPIRPGDTAGADWLRSCIWPEHTARVERLDAALAEVAARPPRFVRGDMVEALPDVLAAVPADTVPLVFSYAAVTYLTDEARVRLVETLARVGARRELAVVLTEAAYAGVRLFDRETSVGERGGPAYAHWRTGAPTVLHLGHGTPHGDELSWSPTPVRWRPVGDASGRPARSPAGDRAAGPA
jgi:hypothetical protein